MSQFYPDWKMVAVRDGRGFHVDVGAFSDPLAGGGDTAVIDIDRPRAAISVPTLTSIIPIRISVQCQSPLIATDADEMEILVGVDIAAVTVAGTGSAETALKMKIGGARTSLCTCKSIYSVACTTAPVIGMELARKVKVADITLQGSPVNALWGDLDLVYEPNTPPILVGPCALYVYWGGTVATTGFAQIEWLEYKTTDFN